jgi:hypothetical protein
MRHVDSRAFSFVVLIVAFSLIYAGILNAAVSSIEKNNKRITIVLHIRNNQINK